MKALTCLKVLSQKLEPRKSREEAEINMITMNKLKLNKIALKKQAMSNVNGGYVMDDCFPLMSCGCYYAYRGVS